MKTSAKRTIRQNRWDNWNGYIGRTKVVEFGTRKDDADYWVMHGRTFQQDNPQKKCRKRNHIDNPATIETVNNEQHVQRIAEEIAHDISIYRNFGQIEPRIAAILAREFAAKESDWQAMQEQANAWQAVYDKLSTLAEFGSVWLDKDTGCSHALRTIDAILARAEREEAKEDKQPQ